jgi:hypothetical protein
LDAATLSATAIAVWIGICCVGALALALAAAAVLAWWRERRLPALRRTDAAFGRGMASFVAGLLFVFAAGITLAVRHQWAVDAASMDECVQHRPRYECTALWRADDRDPAIIPLLIPIPMR